MSRADLWRRHRLQGPCFLAWRLHQLHKQFQRTTVARAQVMAAVRLQRRVMDAWAEAARRRRAEELRLSWMQGRVLARRGVPMLARWRERAARGRELKVGTRTR